MGTWLTLRHAQSSACREVGTVTVSRSRQSAVIGALRGEADRERTRPECGIGAFHASRYARLEAVEGPVHAVGQRRTEAR